MRWLELSRSDVKVVMDDLDFLLQKVKNSGRMSRPGGLSVGQNDWIDIASSHKVDVGQYIIQ